MPWNWGGWEARDDHRRYPSAELGVAKALASLPPPAPARRPDVLAAQHTFNAAFHLVQTAQAARLPSISLSLASGYMNNDVFNALRLRPMMWTAAANLLAPLYTGGYLNAQVKIANENQKAALLLYGQTVLAAFGDVEVNLTNEGLLRDQLQETEATLKLALGGGF